MPKYLGIEIGGTKLQLGVGSAESVELEELARTSVDVSAGASGIVEAIEELGSDLLRRHDVEAVGVGFGGPVNTQTGVVTTSHQIAGWDSFPLGERLANVFKLPVCIDNDCNVAALGEAKLGAGQGSGRVFYVTVGTGIGGGFVIDGSLDGNLRPAISEIGHLRPGTVARSNEQTVEHIASGWGIERMARARLVDCDAQAGQRLLSLCNDDPSTLTSKQVGVAVHEGDGLATEILDEATETLGWAVAQVITLLAPDVVVIGGGVSLIGDAFFDRVRSQVATFVFPPLLDSFSITPAKLGEEVVVHGALQLCRARGEAKDAG